VTWIFSRLVPKDLREALIGDLMEEYARRSNASSPAAARKWYLRQICASILPMLWMRLRRATWLVTLGVALISYLAVAIVQPFVRRALSTSFASSFLAFDLIALFATITLIGFFAERLRRWASLVLGVLLLATLIVMTASSTADVPLWYRISYFFVVPAAAVLGSVLSSRRSTRN
jgi:peptidoglycan/LPS O-acetylase OafA/YrhL